MKAQVTLFGTPSNFDVLNDTGKDAHGFEIQIDGITPADLGGVWTASRYPYTVRTTATGIVIQYASPYVNGQYTTTTVVPAVFAPTGGHSCVFGAVQGCKHYGYYLSYSGNRPTLTVNRWLVDNPQNPGTLIAIPGQVVQIPVPVVAVFPPAAPKQRRLKQPGEPGNESRAVIRKYEFYKYSGPVSPLNNKALCGGDGLCTSPLGGELGDFIGNQMAANVGLPGVTVVKTGNGSGTVSGAGKINCGGTCATPVALGTAVTLTAKADSNSTFVSWTGDCAGFAATCNLNVSGENTVTANFVLNAPAGGGGGATFKISVSKNGKGTVTSNPVAASYAAGTVVTLTATPDAGQSWTGWGGACSDTATTCTLTMNANLSVTANFR